MTKKHFEAIAAIIKSDLDALSDVSGPAAESAREACENIAVGMADYFASENPRFDREKFLTACGVV